MQSLMGGFRLAVGRVSLVHTLCYCQHRAPGRRARLDAGGQRMPCKFSSPSHPVLLSAQGPGGAEHVEVQEAGGGAPRVDWSCRTPLSWSRTAELSPPRSAAPQATTDPSARIAANAWLVAWIWADLELLHCHRHGLQHPRQRRIHLLESPQTHDLWPESASRPWADLELLHCHRHGLQHPRQRRIHLLESPQTHDLWPESASRPWADLGLPHCHRHGLQHPRQRRIHLLESPQTHDLWPESIYVVAWDSALDLRLAQRQRAVTKH